MLGHGSVCMRTTIVIESEWLEGHVSIGVYMCSSEVLYLSLYLYLHTPDSPTMLGGLEAMDRI